uniref:Large ribosomal subunit protein uL24c n=1 Tax=Protohalopteris sp. TaxID=2843287 RepID=A0A8F0F766_9PHAE|nr:ribosomal protein L24 [Protohalopteris sp.]
MKKKVTFKKRINIKVGEKVKIISGNDKGKEGLITKICKSTNQIIVEGVNIKVKHHKPQRPGETGEIKRAEFPIHCSNILRYKE